MVVMAAPVVTVVDYEVLGHRHQSRTLAISLGTESR